MTASLHDLAELGQTLFEEAGDALFLFNPDDENLVDVNPMAQRLSGFSRQQLLARPITYWFRSEQPGGLQRLRLAYRRTGMFHSQEGFLLRHQLDEKWAPVNLSVSRLHAEPRVLGLITARDIRERKAAEGLLRTTEERLRTVVTNAPIILFAVDLKGIVTLSEGLGLRALNLKPGETVGKSVFEMYRRSPRVQATIRRALAGEAFTSVITVDEGPGSGMSFETHYTPLKDSHGQMQGTIAIATDITERLRTQSALVASQERYRELFENANDMIYTTDMDQLFTSFNKAGERITGYASDELIGKSAALLLTPEQREKAQTAFDSKLAERSSRTTYQIEVTRKDGRQVSLEVSTRLIYEHGKPVGVQGIARDVAEREHLESQLRQAQKMEAIGQLAGGIAHDFNNLLTAILGNISLMEMGLQANDPHHEMVKSTERAAKRAAALTQQLLGFSRQTVLRLERVQLGSIVKEVVTLLRRTIDPRIVIERECPDDLAAVEADPNQMNQVLMNLCLNARDAMPEGGRLRIELANCTPDAAYLRSQLESRSGDFVRLSVIDTGTGMSADVRRHLFEPFFTTKETGKGTGLGLAMVFGIVKQHEGWIDCHSEPDKGTRFDIYLPQHHEQVATPPPPETSKIPAGGSETILLVDDEQMLRNIGRSILERFGYKVLLAEDGIHALEVYAREKTNIDLIILDQMMPRMSGKDTLKKLSEINPDVRVILSSGLPTDQTSSPPDTRVLGFIPKPYSPPELASMVRSALDQESGRAT